MRVQVLDAGLLKRLGDVPVELLGDRDQARGPALVAVVVDEALVGAPGFQQGVPRLDVVCRGHDLVSVWRPARSTLGARFARLCDASTSIWTGRSWAPTPRC